MRHAEIEAWALAVVDRVLAGQPLEDARVELKAEWLDPEKAARRLAGHANAARGDPILWVVGVSERDGITGAMHRDLATWYPKVQARFDGVAPELVDLIVPVGNKSVVALLFETGRAPFVIINPLFGQVKGALEREVPWREGTAVRSARREDLMRLLIPRLHRPELEIITGSAALSAEFGRIPDNWAAVWTVRLQLYLAPVSAERLVIPFHKCSAALALTAGAEPTPAETLRVSVPIEVPPLGVRMAEHGRERKKLSITMDNTATELIVDGPGTILLTASGISPADRVQDWPSLHFHADLISAHGDDLGAVDCTLVRVRTNGTHYTYNLKDVDS